MILQYQRKGELLRNYAHVFAVMMRLRQLCCHRELLDWIDWKVSLNGFCVKMHILNLCPIKNLFLSLLLKDVNMQELADHVRQQMEKENIAKALLNGGNPPDDEEKNKFLAEQLRDMIKEGLSDECSICLGEFTQPVITPCAHIYCR